MLLLCFRDDRRSHKSVILRGCTSETGARGCKAPVKTICAEKRALSVDKSPIWYGLLSLVHTCEARASATPPPPNFQPGKPCACSCACRYTCEPGFTCVLARKLSGIQGLGRTCANAHMAYKAKIWRIVKPLTAPRLRLYRK